MLDQLTNGQLQWEPLENPFDQVVIGPPDNRRAYPIYSGRDRFPQELKKCFPGEEKVIDEYMRLVKVCCYIMIRLVYLEIVFQIYSVNLSITEAFNRTMSFVASGNADSDLCLQKNKSLLPSYLSVLWHEGHSLWFDAVVSSLSQ